MRAAATFLVTFLMSIPVPHLFAATILSQSSGSWSSKTTWAGGVVPGDGDEAVISEGHTVTIDQNIGSSGRGILMLRVGTQDGSTAVLKYDGAGQPTGYKITFASTGKVESGSGQNAYGIRFFGKVDLEGTPDHPLTIEPRVQDGSAYTFIQKDPNSSHVDLTLKQTRLRFLGDELNPAVNARDAQGAGERVALVENRMENSGFIQLAGVDGRNATLMVSANVAVDHKGPFVKFRAARNLTINDNQITLATFAPGGANGQAIIDSQPGDGVGSLIKIIGNTLVSPIDAESATTPRVYGIWLEGFSNSMIQGNRISAEGVPYGHQEGIAVFGGKGDAAKILVDGNVVSNSIHGIGIHTVLNDDPGIVVSRNRVFDNRNEHIYISEGFQIRIMNNIIYGTLHSGQAGILLYNTDQVQILNNTLDGPPQDISTAGIAVGNQGFATSTNVTIKNNLLTRWDKAIQNRPAGNTFVEVSHQLFFADRLTYDLTPIPGAGARDVAGDPKYFDPASHDYHLGFGSAAIDRADPAGAPATDFDGEARPGGAGFDIGADELPTGAPSAGLAVSIIDRPDPATVGERLTDTITVANQGPDAATNVTMTLTLSGDVASVSFTPSQGSCNGTTTCNLGSLAAGASATVQIGMTPNSANPINHSVRVEGHEADPDPSDNTAAEQTAVNPKPVADLSVGFVDDGPVIAGENLTYKITVANQGPSDLTSVTLTDALPKNVTAVSSNPSQGACSGTVLITCSLGGLKSGAKAYVDIRVKTVQPGTLTNTVEVIGDLTDPKTADNSATGTAQVNFPPPPGVKADLAVSVSGPSDPVFLGAAWSDTVTITNSGPDPAAAVEVVFEIPLNYATLTGAVWGKGSCPPNELVCPLGPLEAGETIILSRSFIAAAAGSFQNSVSVRSAVADPDSSNNTAAETMTVKSKSEPPLPIDPPAQPPSASGFGCGMTGAKGKPKENTFHRSDTGDLLLLSFPFLYALFRRRRPTLAASRRGMPFLSFRNERIGMKGFALLFLVLLPWEAAAAVINSAATGSWSSKTTWAGGVVPGDGDEVVISEGHTVAIDQNIGSSGRGILMLRVGTQDGSTAALKYDGAGQPAGYKITFASTGKVESGSGQNAYGIRFFGKVDLEGTPDHPLTIEPRVQDGSAYTFIQKDPNSSHVDLTLKQTRLRFLGDELNPAVNARDARKAGERVMIVENKLEKSGFIQLAGVDGQNATLMISGNTAVGHKGPFVEFRAARNLTINDNQITLATFAPGGANGQAIIDSQPGDGVGSLIKIIGNTLVSPIDAEDTSPAAPRVYGIWLEGFSNSVIRENNISATGVAYGYQEGIAVNGGKNGDSINVLVEGNVVAHSSHGIGIHTEEDLNPGPGFTHQNPGVQVTRNRVYDNRNEHIFVSKGYQVRITNNVLYGSLHTGQAAILLYMTDQVQIANNTLDGLQPTGTAVEGVHGIALGNKTDATTYTSSNVTLINNVLTHFGEGIQNRESNNTFQKVGYNLFFGNLKNYDELSKTTFVLPAAPPGDLFADPMYVNPASRDYHLQAGSPAIDKGTAVPAPLIDIDGQTRPVGGGMDIGADELSSNPPKDPIACLASPCGGGSPSGGDAGGPPVSDAPGSSQESGFGCGMVQPRSSNAPSRRSAPGDLLLLAAPFFYWLFRKNRKAFRLSGRSAL